MFALRALGPAGRREAGDREANSPTSITAYVPNRLNMVTGDQAVNITVTTASAAVTSNAGFTALAPRPGNTLASGTAAPITVEPFFEASVTSGRDFIVS